MEDVCTQLSPADLVVTIELNCITIARKRKIG